MTMQNSSLTAGRCLGFVAAVLMLCLAFGGGLHDLFLICTVSDDSELYSYILLIPFVSAYLAWLQMSKFPRSCRPAGWAAAGLLTAGVLAIATTRIVSPPTTEDGLALRILAFVLLLAGICAAFLGRERLRMLAFPLAFLAFMIPLPSGIRENLETFLQYGSATAANMMFTLSGVSVYQDNLSFHLPGNIRFNVAPECSGIHSTLVLLITGLVAAHLLLRTWWKQALLVVVVVPLALLRNGFRIYVIGQLCVHYGPRMFESWVHRRGGPLFFAISMIPFFILLLWLVRSERSPASPGPNHEAAVSS